MSWSISSSTSSSGVKTPRSSAVVDDEPVRKYYRDDSSEEDDEDCWEKEEIGTTRSSGPCSRRGGTSTTARPVRHLSRRRLLFRQQPHLKRRNISIDVSFVVVGMCVGILLLATNSSATSSSLSPTSILQDTNASSRRSWISQSQKRHRRRNEHWIASSTSSSSLSDNHHHSRFGGMSKWFRPFRTHRSNHGGHRGVATRVNAISGGDAFASAAAATTAATLRNHSETLFQPTVAVSSSSSPSIGDWQTMIRTRIDMSLSSLWSCVTGMVATVHHTRRPWGQYAVTACQVTLVFYLLGALWNEVASSIKALSSTLESELRSESPPLVTDTEEVRNLIDFLELLETYDRTLQERDELVQKRDVNSTGTAIQLPEALKKPSGGTGSGSGSGSGSATSDIRVRRSEPLALLGQRLHTAGLPWRADASISSNAKSTDNDARTTKPAFAPLPSVESVLLQLTKTEAALVRQCLRIPPSLPPPLQDSGTTRDDMWDSVMGLDAIKDRMMATLSTIFPPSGPNSNHAYASLFGNTVQQSSSLTVGMLLYGPPGCGKTLLVKALASKARIPCLVITSSVLLRKYVGETNQQVRALFTLASKLAPCIVCIDELDGLFRERSDGEHEVSRDLKTEFLQWLDGMTVVPEATSAEHTAPSGRHSILVIGATNRPFDVDSALLRRLPHSICVKLPDDLGRFQVLQKLLETVPTTSDLEIDTIAQRTEFYSPSDLRQVLQMAVLMGPMKRSGLGDLATEDIVAALDVISPTALSHQYLKQLNQFMERQPAGTITLPSSSTLPELSSAWTKFAPLVVTHLDTGVDKWETSVGNFYNVGTLEIDTETFKLLNEIVQHNIDWEDNDTTNNNNDDT